MRVRRERLYEEVWAEPMTVVASRYGVSSNYLARVCHSLNVPHPKRGYWARQRVGTQGPIPALPPAKPGDAIEWVKGAGSPARATFANYKPPASPKRTEKSTRPARHRLIVTLLEHLEASVLTEKGYLRPRKRNVADVFVAKNSQRVALDTLNALFLELESRGYIVDLAGGNSLSYRPHIDVYRRGGDRAPYDRDNWSPGRPTIATVLNVPLGLALYELCESTKVRYMGHDRYVPISQLPGIHRYAPELPHQFDITKDVPTGRLVLRAYAPHSGVTWHREWEEQASGDLKRQVVAIVDHLETSAPIVANLIAEADAKAREERRRWEAECRQRERRERAERRATARKESREQLLTIIGAWSDAKAVEAFLTEIEFRSSSLADHERSEIVRRLAAARELVGSPDVLSRFAAWRIPPKVSPDQDVDE